MLIQEYNFNFENMAVYYLWDRDPYSNINPQLIIDLLSELTNSRDIFTYNRQGMLLLSYPSIEAYTMSNFVDNVFSYRFAKKSEINNKMNDKNINPQKITGDSINSASMQMIDAFNQIGVVPDYDDMREANTSVFSYQENEFNSNKSFR